MRDFFNRPTSYHVVIALTLALSLFTGCTVAEVFAQEEYPNEAAVNETSDDGVLAPDELVTLFVVAPESAKLLVCVPVLQPVEPIMAGQDARIFDVQPRDVLQVFKDHTLGQECALFDRHDEASITIEGTSLRHRTHEHAPTLLHFSVTSFDHEGKERATWHDTLMNQPMRSFIPLVAAVPAATSETMYILGNTRGHFHCGDFEQGALQTWVSFSPPSNIPVLMLKCTGNVGDKRAYRIANDYYNVMLYAGDYGRYQCARSGQFFHVSRHSAGHYSVVCY